MTIGAVTGIACLVAIVAEPTNLFNFSAIKAVRDTLQSGRPSRRVNESYTALINAANGYLGDGPWSFNRGPWSVMNKSSIIAPKLSKHEYVSIGIYNHPCNALPAGCKPYPGGHLLPPKDCDNNTGLPWEPCDGLRNPSAIAEGDSPRAGAMRGAVQHLGMAAYFCVEPPASCAAYTAKAVQVIRAWFLDPNTRMNADLLYGQIDPKGTPPAPGHGGFIEWANTAVFLDGITLLAAAGPAPPQYQADLLRWFVDFEKYIEGPYAQGERKVLPGRQLSVLASLHPTCSPHRVAPIQMSNNHGSWYDVTWQSVALFTGNITAAHSAATEVTGVRIPTQLSPDGREIIELERANPAGYCIYNLGALTSNAQLAANNPR
eukprot:gene2504-3251_t